MSETKTASAIQGIRQMEPILHFAIPFAIIAILGFKLRWAFLGGVFGILPDFDVFALVHRSGTHSILIPLAILIIPIFIKNSKIRIPLLALSIGLLSHVLFDFATWYTPILWPISQDAYRLVFEWNFHLGSAPTTFFTLNILAQPYTPEPFTTLDVVLFNSESLVLSGVIAGLATAINRRSKNILISRKRDKQ